jgi:hypothetical protein
MAIARAAWSAVPAPAPSYEWVSPTAAPPPMTEAAAATPGTQFPPRDGAGALVFRNRMWLIGGWNPSDPGDFPLITSNDVWSSTDGATWTMVKPNTFRPGVFNPNSDWEGRHMAGYVVFNDKMWILGGDAEQGHYQNDVWNSADGVHWSLVTSNVPWGDRVLTYTVVFNNKIWVMGGQQVPQFVAARAGQLPSWGLPTSLFSGTALSGATFYNDIWNSSDGVNWVKVHPEGAIWSPRGVICGSVVFNGRMWVIGGGQYNTPSEPQGEALNDVWSSADGSHWTRVNARAPWRPRIYHDVGVFANRIWVIAGNSGNAENLSDAWNSTDGVHWTQVPNSPWLARHAASLWVYRNWLYLGAGTAGTGDNGSPQNDVWGLNAVAAPSPALLIDLLAN